MSHLDISKYQHLFPKYNTLLLVNFQYRKIYSCRQKYFVVKKILLPIKYFLLLLTGKSTYVLQSQGLLSELSTIILKTGESFPQSSWNWDSASAALWVLIFLCWFIDTGGSVEDSTFRTMHSGWVSHSLKVPKLMGIQKNWTVLCLYLDWKYKIS